MVIKFSQELSVRGLVLRSGLIRSVPFRFGPFGVSPSVHEEAGGRMKGGLWLFFVALSFAAHSISATRKYHVHDSSMHVARGEIQTASCISYTEKINYTLRGVQDRKN